MIALVRAEWIKLRTVTSHWILAAIGVAFTPIVVVLTAIFVDESDVDARMPTEVTVGTTIVMALLFGTIGVLSFAQEHAHGTIRVTYAAEPRQTRVLIAKAAVLAITAAVLSAVTVVVTYVAAIVILNARTDAELGGPEAHRSALFGAVMLCVLLTLLGYAIGLLFRNAPAAIAIFVLWPLLAEPLIGTLLALVFGDGALRWLPYSSGFQMIALDSDSDVFGPVAGGCYFAVWVFGLLIAGIALNTRRDA